MGARDQRADKSERATACTRPIINHQVVAKPQSHAAVGVQRECVILGKTGDQFTFEASGDRASLPACRQSGKVGIIDQGLDAPGAATREIGSLIIGCGQAGESGDSLRRTSNQVET